MQQFSRALVIFVCVFCFAVFLSGAATTVYAFTETYNILLLRLAYSDVSFSTRYTDTQIAQAGAEMHDFFNELSSGNLDVAFTVRRVTLSQTRAHYLNDCLRTGETRSPCPPPILQEAVQLAVDNGASLSGVNAVLLLDPGQNGDYTDWPRTIQINGAAYIFPRMMDFEGIGTPAPGAVPPGGPGGSGVWWNGWAHEIGHGLQMSARHTNWMGHPAGYSSGYDLMDSCYPCNDSAYALADAPTVSADAPYKLFNRWMPSDRVQVIDEPASGTINRTIELAPLSQDYHTVAGKQVIKLPIGPGQYYLVEARKRLNADTRNIAPGIYDEGIEILKVDESRTVTSHDADGNSYTDGQPVIPINTCGNLFSGPCTNSHDSPALCLVGGVDPPLHVGQVSDRCWPFPLWHVGNTYTDSTNQIQIRVTNQVGNGYTVRVTRGVSANHPDMYIVPWLTPPMQTYESVDIWVDSRCNGWGIYRYPRRDDGTLTGSGDDPCANHQNRIYATVRNVGETMANNVRVTFKVTNPLGVGVRNPDHWTTVGTATLTRFPALGSLAPGASATVYVKWTPRVTLTPEQIEAMRFNFHSCIQVIIEPVTGETASGNNLAQENINVFEARRTMSESISAPTAEYPTLYNEFFIKNTQKIDRTYFLDSETFMPKNWHVSVADDRPSLTLGPNEVMNLPVKVSVPDGQALGESYYVDVSAQTLLTFNNPNRPADYFLGATERHMVEESGLVLQYQTVQETTLTLNPQATKKGLILVQGALQPAQASTPVNIDFTHKGKTTSKLAKTDLNGNFVLTFKPTATGKWQVRGIWQGDLDSSSAVSPSYTLTVK